MFICKPLTNLYNLCVDRTCSPSKFEQIHQTRHHFLFQLFWRNKSQKFCSIIWTTTLFRQSIRFKENHSYYTSTYAGRSLSFEGFIGSQIRKVLLTSTRQGVIPEITVKVRTEAKPAEPHFPRRTKNGERDGLGLKRESTEGSVDDERLQFHWHSFLTRLFWRELCWLANTCKTWHVSLISPAVFTNHFTYQSRHHGQCTCIHRTRISCIFSVLATALPLRICHQDCAAHFFCPKVLLCYITGSLTMYPERRALPCRLDEVSEV